MRLAIHTLRMGNFAVEVDLSDTVGRVKQILDATQKVGDPSLQKLVHAGKILSDDQTLEAAGVKETDDFLVLMVSKPKATAAPVSQPPAPAHVPSPAPAPAVVPTPAPAPAPQPTTPAALPGVATPSDETVQSVIDMGFSREEALAALSAAFGNVERAVEYLFNGIPDSVQSEMVASNTGHPNPQQPSQPPAPLAQASAAPAASPALPAPIPTPLPPTLPAAPPPVPAPAPPPAPPAAPLFTADSIAQALHSPAAPPSPVQQMRSNPQMMQLVAMVRQNPNMLQPLLEEIARSNPQLLQFIQQNQPAFQEVLNGPLPTPTAASDMQQQTSGPVPQQIRVELSSEDREAVERLQNLGFPQDAVVQAYLACDKNEQLAANLLFDGMAD